MKTQVLPLAAKILSEETHKNKLYPSYGFGNAASILAFYYADVKNDINSAKAILRNAVKLGYEHGKRNLAYFLIREKSYMDAIDELDKIDIKLIRNPNGVYELYVVCYTVLEKFDKAKEYYDLIVQHSTQKELEERISSFENRFDYIDFSYLK